MRVIEVKSCGGCPYCWWRALKMQHECRHPLANLDPIKYSEIKAGEFPRFCPLKEAKT